MTISAPAQGATVTTGTPTVSGTAGTAAGDTDQVSVAFYPSSGVQEPAAQTVQATVGANGSLTVKIDFSHSTGDIDLVLQSSSGTQLAISESTADSETVSKTGLAAGTYYARVYGYNGAKAPYSMTVTVAGGGTTPTTQTGVVTAGTLNVRSGPGTTYPIVTTLSLNTTVTVLETSGMWYRVSWSAAPAGQTQLWVYKTYVRLN